MKTGAEQFKDWMDRRGFTQRETAAHFGWDETFIAKLCRGQRSPGLGNAVKIERETGIPVEAWMSSEQDGSSETVSTPSRKRKLAKASN